MAGMPAILQAGPLEIKFAGIENLVRIAIMAAEKSPLKFALHLDHGDSFEMAEAAVNAGFTSIMIDASLLPYKENLELTQKVVAVAYPHGVSVESELGKLSGSEAGKTLSEEEAAQTDPDEAQRFVADAGIDALAVAIGTAHGFYKFKPRLNLERLQKISEKVTVPLVLHGGSDTPNDQILQAVDMGIAKVNICTEFVAAFGKDYTAQQAKPDFKYNVPNLFESAKRAGRDLALAKIKLYGKIN
jgi:fructose-bisphosphate aldolase class II